MSGPVGRSATPARLLAALVVVTGLVACSSDTDSTTSDASSTPATGTAADTTPTSSSGESSGSTGESPASVADLEAAGIQVVERDDASVVPVAPLMLQQVQAARLAADVGPESGWLGANLDALAPVPEGVPPLSFIIAGWISVAGTTASETAAAWMGEHGWTQAQTVHFPDAVIALFVNDIASMVAADAAGAPDDSIQIDLRTPASLRAGGGGGDVRGIGGRSSARLDGACSTVQNFVNTAFASLINALHITPPGGNGILALFGQALVAVLNAASSFALGLLQGLATKITEPVFNLVKVAVATAGLVTVIGSYLSDTHLNVKLVPGQGAQQYRFAIGDESDIRGEFVASGPNLTGQWPPALVDCAASTGVPLPAAIGVGAAATWTLSGRTDLIVPDGLNTTVRDDLTARLGFATGRETEEDATGEQSQANTFVKVDVPRKDVQDLAKLGKTLIDQSLASVVAVLPPGVSDLALAALHLVTDPLVAQLESVIQGLGGQILGLSGTHLVNVTFHVPPEPTTTPVPPTAAPTEPPGTTDPKDSEFCVKFKALGDWVATQDVPLDSAGWYAYGSEVVRRFEDMRPVTPEELLGDLDTLTVFYRSLRDSTNYTGSDSPPDVGNDMWRYCGF